MQRIKYRHPETKQEFLFEQGTTPEDARRRMDAYYSQQQAQAEAAAAAEDEAYKDYMREHRTSIGSGVRRGIGQLPILGSQALAAGAGLFGANDTRDALLQSAAERQQELDSVNPRLYDSFTADPLGYIGETVGEQLPNMATMIGGGGIGALGAKMLAKRAGTGFVAGAAAPSFGLQAGENYGSYVDEYGVDNASPGMALGVAVPQAALDVVGPLSFLKSMRGFDPLGASDKVLRKEARRGLMGAAGIGALRGAGRGAVTEGVTEGAQEALKMAGGDASQGQFGESFSDPNKLAQIGQSVGVGALTGGLFGGAFGAPGGVATRNRSAELRRDRAMDSLEQRRMAREPVPPTKPNGPLLLPAPAATPALPAPRDDFKGTGRTPALPLDPNVDVRAFAANQAAVDEMRSAASSGPLVPQRADEPAPPDMRSTDEENRTLPGMQPSLFDDGAPAPRDQVAPVFEKAGLIGPDKPRNAYERQARRVGELMATKSAEGIDPMAASSRNQELYDELVRLKATANRPAALATPGQKAALDQLIESLNPETRAKAEAVAARTAAVESKTKPATAADLAKVAAKVEETKATPPSATVSRAYKGNDGMLGTTGTQASEEELTAARDVWNNARGDAPAWDDLADSPFFVEKTPEGEQLTTLEGKGDAQRPDPAVSRAIAEDVKRVFARRLAEGKFTPETAAAEVQAAAGEAATPTPTIPESLGPKASRGQKADAGPRGRTSAALKAARQRAAEALDELITVRAAIQASKNDTDPANRPARLALVAQEKKANEKYLAAVAEAQGKEEAARAADPDFEFNAAATKAAAAKRAEIKRKLAAEAKAKPKKETAAKVLDKAEKEAEKDAADIPEIDEYTDDDYNEDPTFNLRYRKQQKAVEKADGPIKSMPALLTRLRRLAERHFKGVEITFITDLDAARSMNDPMVNDALDNDAKGFMTADKRIFIVLPNATSELDAEMTLFHEPGHLFMRAVPADVLKAMMSPFTRNAKIMADAEKWMRDNKDRVDQFPEVDWKAIALEEAIVENGREAFAKFGVKQLASKFINWLRRLGATKLADFLARQNDDIQTIEFLFEMRRRHEAQGSPDGSGGPTRFRGKDRRDPDQTVSTSTADLMASRNLRDVIDKEIRGERKTMFKAAAERLLNPAKAKILLPTLDLRSLAKLLDEVAVRLDPDGLGGPFANVGRNVSKWLHEQDATAQSIRASFERNALDPLVKLQPDVFKKTQELLYKASFARFDPREGAENPGAGKDDKSLAEQKELVREYKALGKEGQKAFAAVADTTRNSFNEMKVQMIKHAERMLASARDKARDASPEEAAALQADVVRRKNGLERLNQLLKQIGEVMPYVPFKRQGDHLISFIDPTTKVETVWAYETNTERDRAYEALKRRGVAKAEKFNRYEEPERFMNTLDSTTRAVLKALRETRGAKESEVAKPSLDPAKPRTKEQIEADTFEEIESHLIDTLLMLNPASRTLDAVTGRKNVPGMDFDILRAISSYAASAARDQSNLRYGSDISKAFADANRMMAASSADPKLRMGVEGRVYMSDEDLKVTQEVVSELNKRRAFIMAPTYAPLANLLTKGGFYFFMGLNPSSALLQLFQMVMVQAPVLSGKYGSTKAFNAMFNAASRVFTTEAPLREFLDKGAAHEMARYDATMLNADGSAKEGADKLTRDYAKLRTSKSRGDQYRAVIVDMIRRGVLNDAVAQDLVDMKEGRNPKSIGSKVEYAMSAMMKMSEQINRTASLVAAFDLATEKSGRQWSDVMDEIEQHIYEGHGDYSAINSPRPWHTNTGKVLLLFKKFGFHMYTMLGMYMRDYLANKNLTKEERQEAAAKFGIMLLTTASMTGLAGMPVYGLLSSLYFMFTSAFGDDEDTRNLTVAMRQGMDKVGVSGSPADAVLGGLPRLMGLNLTSRLGYADVFFRDPDENLDQKKMLEWVVQTLGGPLYGAGEQITRATQKIAGGDLALGTAELMGATTRNFSRAVQMQFEGELRSRRGDQIAETGSWDALLQAVGFAPGRVTEQQEIMFAAKAIDVRLNKTRAAALELYRNAYVLGDIDMMERARDEISDVNATAARLALPKYRITEETLNRSVKSRVKNDANYDKAVRFSPATAPATREVRALAE